MLGFALAGPAQAATGPDTSCRAGISEKVTPRQYAPAFLAVHDAMPPALQRVFCSLTEIHLLKDVDGTAFITGSVMAIRRSILDDHLSLAAWATWKEQLPFGGGKTSYRARKDLPAIAATSKGPVNALLFMMVAHEFAHVLDSANDWNKMLCEGTSCTFAPGTWGALSWASDRDALPTDEFPERHSLCFYSCETPLSRTAIPAFYEHLAHSRFLGAYAATNPADDLAEGLAFYLLDEALSGTYVVDTRQGERYDMIAKLRSPAYAAKRQFLRDALSRTNLK